MIPFQELQTALKCLREGKVIAYPTEAVYGFGCDPFNAQAVSQLLQLKRRSVDKGLILVASSWGQVQSLVEPIPPRALAQVLATWPGPFTWIFPASSLAPAWIRGQHQSIALRVSDHPVVRELCQGFEGPIVSTSANRDGEPPLRDFRTLQIMFGKQVDFIVHGKVGGQSRPTVIRDALSGSILRE
jgi:L-threonylcarbamoyladenylate synthase